MRLGLHIGRSIHDPTGYQLDDESIRRAEERYGRGTWAAQAIAESIHAAAARQFGRLLGECIEWWTR